MPTKLAWNRYGKSRIRLVKLRRAGDGAAQGSHEVVDLTVDVQLEGAFDPVYVDGDNSICVATDTMKNTVYAFARQDPIDHCETFAMRLADHFAARQAVSGVRVSVIEHRWSRLAAGGGPHPHAFVQDTAERWTALVTRDGSGTRVRAGVTDLVLMKTSGSAFSGFPRDEFTTLPETGDRVLSTSVTSTWEYNAGVSDFGVREKVRSALVDRFASHASESLQHTLYAMAEAALEASADVAEITLSMPNRHHLLVDLTPFGLDNPNDVFVATDQPFGLIEATVRRTKE